MKKLKLFNMQMNENTRTKLIVLLEILLCLWLLFYFIPEVFNTLLGNIILVIIVVLVISYNIKYGVLLLIIFIVFYRFFNIFYRFNREKEGFSDPDKTFLLIQDTIHPNKIFDLNMIKKNQATPEELNYFNENGIWPWSDKTKELYLQAIRSNPYIKVAPDAALLETQSIYNETAILMALSYQTKEGQFLINGVNVPVSGGNPAEDLPNGFGDFAYKSGLKTDVRNDVIRCNMDNSSLERIHYMGKDGIYGAQTAMTSPVEYNELENIVSGFSFINGPCNPCSAMKEKPDYSCPFRLEVKDKEPGISGIWKTLWGV